MQTLQTDSGEVGYQRSCAKLRYVNFIDAPITDDNGAVTDIFCGGFDVTERHRAESALGGERLRLALDPASWK